MTSAFVEVVPSGLLLLALVFGAVFVANVRSPKEGRPRARSYNKSHQ